MSRPNVADPSFSYDAEDPEGYRAGVFRPGGALGAQRTGMSVYDVPPGQSICPYHYEYGEEEWLLVLAGRPTLRDPDGEHQLAPMDVAFFAPGPGGAHKVSNRTDAPVRVLMFSNLVDPNATVYPDSDKIAVHTGNPADDHRSFRSNGVGYYAGEGSGT